MKQYCEYIEKASEKGLMDDVWCLVDETMDKLEHKDPSMYDCIVDRLEQIAYKIPKDEAERIVRDMRSKGQNWSYSQIEDFVCNKGVHDNFVNWYLVMNMVYNDYYDTARKYDLQNDADFYYCLAKDFIEDIDAKPMKVEKYFLD